MTSGGSIKKKNNNNMTTGDGQSCSAVSLRGDSPNWPQQKHFQESLRRQKPSELLKRGNSSRAGSFNGIGKD